MAKLNKKNIKILTIFGTRPEAIKLAPVLAQLKKEKSIKSIVCVTAQHRHMLDQVLKIFDIKPDFDLDVMTHDQTLEDILNRVLLRVGKVLDIVKPDIVLVQGDTTSALIIGLACFFRKIKIGHVEAGLRSYDKYRPFPEEINRRLLSHVADFHFAPTKTAFHNLIKENIDKNKIFVTGNTAVDALTMTAGEKYKLNIKNLQRVDFKKRIILVTAHRRESFGEPLKNICLALKEIVNLKNDVEIIYPVHPNPNVRKTVEKTIGGVKRIHLIEPVEYELFVHLMKKCYFVLTDSGGIQEVAPSLGKPVLVMREKTERPEGIKAGCSKLVGVDKNNIVKNALTLLENKKLYKKMAKSRNPYGDGKAAKRIVSVLKKKLR